MRREFLLPEEDTEFLNINHFKWETINDQGMQWLLIHDYPIFEGYIVNSVILAIKLDTGYPRTALDMVYCYPRLS